MKNTLDLIFAGSAEFSLPTLKGLVNSRHNVCSVLTQPDRPKGRGRKITFSSVKTFALDHKLPVHQPVNLKNDQIIETLQSYSPDLLIVVAYGLIIPKRVLDLPKGGGINIHGSLLPRWRGAAPIQFAILTGDDETGITIMQMDEGLDTGDMLLQEKYIIKKSDTSLKVQAVLADMGKDLLLEVLEMYCENRLKPKKQNDNYATYAPKIKKADAKIDWNKPAIEIDRMIRAYNPYPIAFSSINEQIIRIWQGMVVGDKLTGTPGEILNVSKEGIDVATGQGVLRLLECQFPNKTRQNIKELLNAKNHPLKKGSFFK